jgi:hypothetical protein
MTIVNDDSRVVTELETSLTDDSKVIIYDHHMFIVQATDQRKSVKSFLNSLTHCKVALSCAVVLYCSVYFETLILSLREWSVTMKTSQKGPNIFDLVVL